MVTLDSGRDNAYVAATPTQYGIGNPLCRDIDLVEVDAPQCLGDGKIGGSTVPANVPINVRYVNNEGSAKVFKAVLEFLY